MKRLAVGAALAAGMAVLLAAAVAALNVRDEAPVPESTAAGIAPPPADQVARGAYLARAGNCAGCHTLSGGAPYAGGRGIATPFGTVYGPNLTPDATTGIGGWSEAHFWRALHNGRSRDGRLLYPVFPYPNYTRIVRADADALFAFLRSLPPVAQPNRRAELRFPFDTQPALAVWRALYFRPGEQTPEPGRSAAWQRGAYLVEGLGHCNACHSSRNALGASANPLDLGGGLIPVQNWYAPSLTSSAEAGVADWPAPEVVRLLQTGVSANASVLGPMAEVVLGSTQYLTSADLQAMAVFLQALRQTPSTRRPAATPAVAAGLARGAQRYADDCAACHGERGEGRGRTGLAAAHGAYPALAGNRAVVLDPPANLVHIVLEGGFAPATAGNPRPFGMPPFANVLSNDELADVLSYIRSAWGNRGSAVTAIEVDRYRGGR